MRWRIILGGWRWGVYITYREQLMMLSTIYGRWRILIMWWVLWLLVATFWWIIHSRRLWEYGSKMDKTCWRSSSKSCHLIGIFITAMWLNITTTSVMNCHQLKIHVWLILGSVGCLLEFWPSCRLMHFWFYITFFYCGLRLEVMPAVLYFVRKLAWQIINIIYIEEQEGGVVSSSILRSLFDDCTKAYEKILE